MLKYIYPQFTVEEGKIILSLLKIEKEKLDRFRGERKLPKTEYQKKVEKLVDDLSSMLR